MNSLRAWTSFTQGVNFVFAVDEFLNGSCCRIEMKGQLSPLNRVSLENFLLIFSTRVYGQKLNLKFKTKNMSLELIKQRVSLYLYNMRLLESQKHEIMADFRNSIFSRQSFLRTTKSSRWKKIPRLIGEERNWWHILTRERRWRKRNERRVQSYHHPLKPSNLFNFQNFLCIMFHASLNNNWWRRKDCIQQCNLYYHNRK